MRNLAAQIPLYVAAAHKTGATNRGSRLGGEGGQEG